MTITEVENKLQEYIILEMRIETKIGELRKNAYRDAAIQMGPKDVTAYDATQIPAHTNKGDWLDEFLGRFESIARKQKIISDEMSDCLKRQIEIRDMVDRAGLDDDESLYCELRYFKGHAVKELSNLWPNQKSPTWLNDIRKSALQKIASKSV